MRGYDSGRGSQLQGVFLNRSLDLRMLVGNLLFTK